MNASIKKMKKELLEDFQRLDSQSERRDLTLAERNRLDEINKDLKAIWRMEEIKAQQRSRDRQVKGDRNTTYFMAVANQRNRKKKN